MSTFPACQLSSLSCGRLEWNQPSPACLPASLAACRATPSQHAHAMLHSHTQQRGVASSPPLGSEAPAPAAAAAPTAAASRGATVAPLPPTEPPLSLFAYLQEVWSEQTGVSQVDPLPTFPSVAAPSSGLDAAISSCSSSSAAHPNLLPRHSTQMKEHNRKGTEEERQEEKSRSEQQQQEEGNLSLHSLLRFYQRTDLLSSASSVPSLSGHQLPSSFVFSASQSRFLLYQLLHFLTWLHEERQQAHGGLNPHVLWLHLQNGAVWLQVEGGTEKKQKKKKKKSEQSREETSAHKEYPAAPHCSHCRCNVPRPLSPLLPPPLSLCYQWWTGALSNLDYLLSLNALAGRTREGKGVGHGDVSFHPIVPWVVDFAETERRVLQLKKQANEEGEPYSKAQLHGCIVWRDLTKSKFRLKKGDEQLDFQFQSSSAGSDLSSSFSSTAGPAPSPRPHHITEPLSELAYLVYRARITPLSSLKRVVRHKFVAEEYPSSIVRMEAWTTDEAIPELFEETGAHMFKATPEHKQQGMDDLSIPEWILEMAGGEGEEAAADPLQSFLRWHRSLLESEAVSQRLHHWIDLNVGYKLSGVAAVQAKNVPLRAEQSGAGTEQADAGNYARRSTSIGSSLPGGNEAEPTDASAFPSLSVFDLPRRPAFLQLFDRPHPPRRAPVPAPAKPTDAPAASVHPSPSFLPPSPSSDLSHLHSFEYFHSFNAQLFEPIVEYGCYQAPPPGLLQWKRERDCEAEAETNWWGREEEEEENDTSKAMGNESHQDHDASSSPSALSLAEEQAHDMFQFGLILAELFLPRPLFTARSFHSYCNAPAPASARIIDGLVAPLPADIREVVHACLQLDWRHRPRAGELLRQVGPMRSIPCGLFEVHVPAVTQTPFEVGAQPTPVLSNPYAFAWKCVAKWREKVRECMEQIPTTTQKQSSESRSEDTALDQPASPFSTLLTTLLNSFLPSLHSSLSPLSPSLFLLVLPHLLSVCLTPTLLFEVGHHSLLRSLLDEVSRLIGPTPSKLIVRPFLLQLLSPSMPRSFQMAFTYQPETLMLMRRRFAHADMLKPFLSRLCTTLCDNDGEVAAQAHELLTTFILEELDLHGDPPSHHVDTTAPSSIDSRTISSDSEILLFDILRPLFRWLLSPPAAAHVSSPTAAGGSLRSSPASNGYRITNLLMEIIPELSSGWGSRIILPSLLTILQGNSGQTSENTPSSHHRVPSSFSLSARSSQELNLASALTLLSVLLPHLPRADLLTLIAPGSILHVLLHSNNSHAPLDTKGVRPVHTLSLHTLIDILMGCCDELAEERGHSPASDPHLTALLSSLSDFLVGLLLSLEEQSSLSHLDSQPPPPATSLPSLSDLLDLLHHSYMLLLDYFGDEGAMQQVIPLAHKIQRLLGDRVRDRAMDSYTKSLVVLRRRAARARQRREEAAVRQQNRAAARRIQQQLQQDARALTRLQAGILVGQGVGPATSTAAARGKQRSDRRESAVHTAQGEHSTPHSRRASVTAAGQAPSNGEQNASREGGETVPASATARCQEEVSLPRPKSDAPLPPPAPSLPSAPHPKKKKAGFFSTGIFAKSNSASTVGKEAAAAASSLPSLSPHSNASGNVTTPNTVVSLPPRRGSASLHSPSLITHQPVSIDLPDLLLPPSPVASSASSPRPRFQPAARCLFRGHAAAVTSIDCHPTTGLFVSGSRSGDGAHTLKLWSLSASQGEIRPLINYSRAHSSLPKNSIVQVKLMCDSSSILPPTLAYTDSRQLHLLDIETQQPILYRRSSRREEEAGGRMQQVKQRRGSALSKGMGSKHVISSSPSFDPLDASSLGGLPCFASAPSLHSLLLGTPHASLHWLDLRSGVVATHGWSHASSSTSGGMSLRCIALEEEEGGSSEGALAPHRVYTGLSTGEIAVFDRRTGCVLTQWRAHDAAIGQLLPFHAHGCLLLLSSGLDQFICLWLLSPAMAAPPLLLQRFTNLDHPASHLYLRPAVGGGKEVVCTAGSERGVGRLLSPFSPSRSLHSQLSWSRVSAPHPLSSFTTGARLHAYDLDVLGCEDGRIALVN